MNFLMLVNAWAMFFNIFVFAITGSWVNAGCAVISAAATGYCQWDIKKTIEMENSNR